MADRLGMRVVHDDGNGVAAAIGNLGKGDLQLAGLVTRARLRGVARTSEPDDAREAAVAALDEVKARFAAHAPWRFFAGAQHAVAFRQQPHRFHVDARQIDHDLDRIVGFVDVDGRRAFAGQRFGAEDPSDLEKNAADLIGKITDFRRDGDRLNASAHSQESSHSDLGAASGRRKSQMSRKIADQIMVSANGSYNMLDKHSYIAILRAL